MTIEFIFTWVWFLNVSYEYSIIILVLDKKIPRLKVCKKKTFFEKMWYKNTYTTDVIAN